jgi:predicted peptidase
MSSIPSDSYTRGAQVARKMKRGNLNYLFFVPRSYGKDDSAWPLLLFLHGAGERGSDVMRVKKHGPPKIVENEPDFPFLVASPQCPVGSHWNPGEIIGLLDELIESEAVDLVRIYLSGMSMGGYGAWETAIAFPDRFAALAPVCGGGDPRQVARIKHLPVWAFHGEKDDIVPVGATLEMVEALRAAGGNVRMTIYPELAHDSWTETYNNPELYTWLLAQQKSTESTQ